MQPLPNKRRATRTDERNTGLLFNKFFNKWPHGANDGPGENKAKWLTSSFNKPLSISAAATKRIENLANATDGKAVTYQTTGPFVTGMGLPHAVENGFLWHHTLGCPYLPGSSVKGMVRAWAEHWLGEDPAALIRLFGGNAKTTPSIGGLIFHDALPIEPLTLYTEIITPHTGDWRITDTPENSPPADWISPVPIPFLAVKEGAKFQFAISARNNATQGDLDLGFEWLEQALEWIGAGAKTAIGFGRFETNQQIRGTYELGDRVLAMGPLQGTKRGLRSGKIIRMNEDAGRTTYVVQFDPMKKRPDIDQIPFTADQMKPLDDAQ